MADEAAAASWSLERRLSRELALALFVLWMAGTAGALYGMWHETGEVLDSALQQTAQRLLALPESALVDTAAGPTSAPGEAREVVTAFEVFGANGRLLARSPGAPGRDQDGASSAGGFPSGQWRVIALSRPDGSRRVFVAEATEHRREVLWRGLAWLVVPLVAIIGGAAWVLRWVLQRAFRQIDTARRHLATQAVQDLHPLTGSSLPEEMQPWIATVNELIGKVRKLVATERSLAAQTAHELRTPLAAARAQAQRLTATVSDEASRAAAQALLRQLDRLARLSTRLLQLARIESGVPPKLQPVDLAGLAALVADEFPEARTGGRLRVECTDRAQAVQADIDLLGIALRNLIDNALKHSGPQARVTLAVAPARLTVIDDGPGVDPDTLAGLVQPFERGQALSEGSGLGLAIVDRIVRQFGASMTLSSPVDGGHGFAATIRFAA
jgi:two-component system OmpR family sensor kinase